MENPQRIKMADFLEILQQGPCRDLASSREQENLFKCLYFRRCFQSATWRFWASASKIEESSTWHLGDDEGFEMPVDATNRAWFLHFYLGT
jgi:hypothetical protein